MEEPSKHTTDDFPVEKQPSTNTPTFQKLSPIFRLSPHHNGSTLYDSYELQAVTRQLNKAMHGSIGSSHTYLSLLNSPFYRHRLDCIYKENVNTPKRFVCSVVTGATSRKTSMRGTDSATWIFVTKLWKKVKQGLLWNKQRIQS